MPAMAVDKEKSRAQSVQVACYNLNAPDHLLALRDFIEKHHEKVCWALFAPSCGTASRARGQPLPKLERLGANVPKPLRSALQPMGLDGLARTDKVKAETANNTYESKCILIRLCHRLAIAVSLANPEDSSSWKIPASEELMEKIRAS